MFLYISLLAYGLPDSSLKQKRPHKNVVQKLNCHVSNKETLMAEWAFPAVRSN
jgi:hypothetical protein